VTGDDPIARDALVVHAEVACAVDDQGVQLLERAGVDEGVDPLVRGELSGRVLLGHALVTTADARLCVAPPHLFQPILLHRSSRAAPIR
jgi:hypothetical protein